MKQWEKLRLFFSIVWRTSHAYVLLMASSVLLAGAQVLLNVLLPKFLIDELTGALRGEYLLLYAGMIVGLNLVLALLNSAVKRGLDEKELYVNNMMDRVMAEKVMKVPFGCLETPEYLDLKERALFAFNNQSAPYQMIRNTAQFLQSALIIITTLAVMLTLSPVLVLLLMLCVAANLFAYSRVMQDQLKFYASLIPINRKYGYYVNLGFQDTLQKDVRLYDMSGMISGRVTDYGREISGECDQFYKKMGRFQGLSGALNDLQSALAYGYAGLRVLGSLSGKAPISLGSLTMYVSAAASFAKAATDAGASAVTITAMLGYLEPFLQFMSLPEESDFGGTLLFSETVESIRFEHVSFRYPGSETRVLHDVSFEIRGGEKISIVGLNGAGKTTLVKLISRLYRPEEGRILLNGVDIFEYEHTSYLASIAAVFQDYKLFAFSIDENITGCRPGSDLVGTGTVIRRVGLNEKMAELDEGVYSMLGKSYDENGVELSGGERQKVAIARALYKNAPVIILDEPTSALDPLAEAEIYENFNSLIGDKTAIYISHRMSSSVFCDRILLLDGGTVSGFDTHAALMEKADGLYYKLFNAQAENYRIEKNV